MDILDSDKSNSNLRVTIQASALANNTIIEQASDQQFVKLGKAVVVDEGIEALCKIIKDQSKWSPFMDGVSHRDVQELIKWIPYVNIDDCQKFGKNANLNCLNCFIFLRNSGKLSDSQTEGFLKGIFSRKDFANILQKEEDKKEDKEEDDDEDDDNDNEWYNYIIDKSHCLDIDTLANNSEPWKDTDAYRTFGQKIKLDGEEENIRELYETTQAKDWCNFILGMANRTTINAKILAIWMPYLIGYATEEHFEQLGKIVDLRYGLDDDIIEKLINPVLPQIVIKNIDNEKEDVKEKRQNAFIKGVSNNKTVVWCSKNNTLVKQMKEIAGIEEKFNDDE
jgi:hypothetical protein